MAQKNLFEDIKQELITDLEEHYMPSLKNNTWHGIPIPKGFRDQGIIEEKLSLVNEFRTKLSNSNISLAEFFLEYKTTLARNDIIEARYKSKFKRFLFRSNLERRLNKNREKISKMVDEWAEQKHQYRGNNSITRIKNYNDDLKFQLRWFYCQFYLNIEAREIATKLLLEPNEEAACINKFLLRDKVVIEKYLNNQEGLSSWVKEQNEKIEEIKHDSNYDEQETKLEPYLLQRMHEIQLKLMINDLALEKNQFEKYYPEKDIEEENLKENLYKILHDRALLRNLIVPLSEFEKTFLFSQTVWSKQHGQSYYFEPTGDEKLPLTDYVKKLGQLDFNVNLEDELKALEDEACTWFKKNKNKLLDTQTNDIRFPDELRNKMPTLAKEVDSINAGRKQVKHTKLDYQIWLDAEWIIELMKHVVKKLGFVPEKKPLVSRKDAEEVFKKVQEIEREILHSQIEEDYPNSLQR